MDALVDMLKDKSSYYPMFVFFNSTTRCKEFCEKLKKVNINSSYLTGKSSNEKRIEVKNKLCNGNLDVLSLCGVYNEGISIDNIRTVMFGDLRHSDINKVQIMMRASRLHYSKPFYRIIIPIVNDDMYECDMKDIVRTFCKIDPIMKKCIENKSKTRIKIEGIQFEDIEKAELQYEQIYNSIGKFISGKSNEELWYYNLEKVKDFVNKENKRPNEKSKCKNERKIGSWLSTQLRNYKKKLYIMKDNKIRNLWTKFINDDKYKEYFLSNEELWYDNLEKLKEFINIKNKRPLYERSKNINERKIGKWLSHQLINYEIKIRIMKDKKIRNLFEKFINDDRYKEYFLSNEELWYDNLEKLK